MSSRCLTDDEIASLRDVAPGAAPGELAQHLAACQSRALFGAVRKTGVAREPPPLPSLGRALLLLAMVILAIGFFFWTLRQLS